MVPVRDAQYFQQLHPNEVSSELEHYGISAAELVSCVAPCGCCVVAHAWAEIGDPAVWFEVWWLWFAHSTAIRHLAA